MRVRLLLPVLVVVAAVGCFAIGLLLPWIRTTAIIGLCYALAALGVTVLLRAGQISFGHAMYGLVGAYAVGFVGRAYPRLDGLLLIPIGTVVAIVTGGLIGCFVVRYRAIFFGMLNLAISMVFFSLASKLFEYTNGSDGLRVARPTLAGFELERAAFENWMLALTLAASVLLGWLVQRYFRSAAGEALAGVKTNETRLEYLGLSSYRILWTGYVVSAGLVGLSGSIFAVVQGLVTPELGYWLRSGEFVFIAILGGSSHVLGAFLGTLVFEAVKLIAGAFFSGVWQMMLGIVLIVVILVAPNGIVGLRARGSKAVKIAKDAAMTALVRTEGLRLAFGGVVAADGIDFTLETGERLAVIGANGAGKTTFINICTGFIRPDAGTIWFDGHDVTRRTPRQIVRLGLGRSFQLPQLFLDHTVRQCLELAAVGRARKLGWFTPLARSVDAAEVDHALELVGLRDRANEIASSLPEGLRKLLDVAMALMLKPKLLIMDEPTSGVASEDKHDLMATVMAALDERRVTSWFVEHDVDIVTRYATRVAAWIAGRIAADGTPADVMSDARVRREVLGTH